jgi:hypothetical protein
MSKVVLTVSYEINPEKRSEYLEFMKQVKEKAQSVSKCAYSLFELKGRKNWFSEVFTFNSEEEYDNFDEDSMEELVDKINDEFVKDGKVKSTQMIEIL